MKCGERILQPDTKLADYTSRAIELLLVLVERKVLDLETTAVVANMPRSVLLEDLDVGRATQDLLVEPVGDDLANCVLNLPVVEYFLDIQIKKVGGFDRWFPG